MDFETILLLKHLIKMVDLQDDFLTEIAKTINMDFDVRSEFIDKRMALYKHYLEIVQPRIETR